MIQRRNEEILNASNAILQLAKGKGGGKGVIGKCWNCGEEGHLARNCPHPPDGGGKKG